MEVANRKADDFVAKFNIDQTIRKFVKLKAACVMIVGSPTIWLFTHQFSGTNQFLPKSICCFLALVNIPLVSSTCLGNGIGMIFKRKRHRRESSFLLRRRELC